MNIGNPYSLTGLPDIKSLSVILYDQVDFHSPSLQQYIYMTGLAMYDNVFELFLTDPEQGNLHSVIQQIGFQIMGEADIQFGRKTEIMKSSTSCCMLLIRPISCKLGVTSSFDNFLISSIAIMR